MPYFNDFTQVEVLRLSNARGKLSLQFPLIKRHPQSGLY